MEKFLIILLESIVLLLIIIIIILFIIRMFLKKKKINLNVDSINTTSEMTLVKKHYFKRWSSISLNTWAIPLSSDFEFQKINIIESKEVHGHVLIVGGSGSGKTQKIILPFILMNAQAKEKPSFIINDVKGEIFQETNNYLRRNEYNLIQLTFELDKKNLNYFNPLLTIYNAKDKPLILVNKMHLIADFIFDDEDVKDPFWNAKAKDVFFGLIYFLLEKEVRSEEFTFKKIMTIFDNLNLIKDEIIDRKEKSYFFLKEFLIKKESSKTIESIFVTFRGKLSPYCDGVVNIINQKNNFEINDLINEPTALFIKNPIHDESIKNFISLVIYQLNTELINNEKITLSRPIINLLDEFGSFVKIKNFEEWLSISRQKNIWYLIAIQNIALFENKYGNISKYSSNFLYEYFVGGGDRKSYEYFVKDYNDIKKENKALISFNYFHTLSQDEIILKQKKELPKIKKFDNIWKINDTYL